MTRQNVLNALAERIAGLSATHTARVAIDGIDVAGKTTLADELARALQARGRPVIRASIDGFHQPRAVRYRRGSSSPEGYYLDSFDYAALRDALLLPLGPGGSGVYRRAVFDYRTDQLLAVPDEHAPANAVLLMDGIFLLRPELLASWDYRIFVDVSFDVALERAEQRDVALCGSVEAVRMRYSERYLPAQRLYVETAHPREHADAIVHNDDPANPRLRWCDPT